MVCHFLPQGSSRCRDRAWVSCIAGGFFTIRATRESISLDLYLRIQFNWRDCSDCEGVFTRVFTCSFLVYRRGLFSVLLLSLVTRQFHSLVPGVVRLVLSLPWDFLRAVLLSEDTWVGWGWRQKPGHSTQSPGGKGGGFPGWGGRKGRGPGSTGTSLAAPTF